MALPQAFTIAPDNTTVTTFRAWATAIHNALTAGGNLVQTADTGQINLATVTLPATGAVGGYEIYRFNDSLQATSPVFIKIEYGTSASAAGGPQLWVTVGTATDGAGNLTSIANTGVSVSSRVSLTGNNVAAADTTPRQCYVNGDASTLVLALWNAATNTSASILIVERNRDATGAPTGDGVQVIWASGSVSSASVQTILMHNQVTQTALTTSGPAVLPQGAVTSSGIKDGVMSVYPVMTGGGPRLGAPSKFVVTHVGADLAGAGTFSNTHYGATHNWMSWSTPRPNSWGAFAVRTD